jgi:hypothetical protein
MAAPRNDKHVLVSALVLALVGLVLVVGDRFRNADIANRERFDLLLLGSAVVAMACAVGVVVRNRRRRADVDEDDQVIDLRERLGDLVDLDDVAVEAELRLGR